MVKLQFPDGSIREFEEGKTLLEVAESISISLKKKCIAAKLNDELVEMDTVLASDASIVFVTQENPEAFDILNHSTAHLLAHAISELYPHAKMGVGPAIEEGFYYDFDLGETKIEPSDLAKIEKKMMELSNKDIKITHYDLSKEEAKTEIEKFVGKRSFFANPKYEQYVYECKADIIIVNKTFEPKEPVSATMVRVEDSYAAVAALLDYVTAKKRSYRRLLSMVTVIFKQTKSRRYEPKRNGVR